MYSIGGFEWIFLNSKLFEKCTQLHVAAQRFTADIRKQPQTSFIDSLYKADWRSTMN